MLWLCFVIYQIILDIYANLCAFSLYYNKEWFFGLAFNIF